MKPGLGRLGQERRGPTLDSQQNASLRLEVARIPVSQNSPSRKEAKRLLGACTAT